MVFETTPYTILTINTQGVGREEAYHRLRFITPEGELLPESMVHHFEGIEEEEALGEEEMDIGIKALIQWKEHFLTATWGWAMRILRQLLICKFS